MRIPERPHHFSLFDMPFGFMSLLGFLSLSGMLMKNEIVLLDQINLERAKGALPFQAVIDSAVSRVRPVCLASFTTVLGMIPLLWDPFFGAMAVTIMGGLTFATVLTLIVVPVLYCTLFGITEEHKIKIRRDRAVSKPNNEKIVQKPSVQLESFGN